MYNIQIPHPACLGGQYFFLCLHALEYLRGRFWADVSLKWKNTSLKLLFVKAKCVGESRMLEEHTVQVV